jgi:hypothetical protein
VILETKNSPSNRKHPSRLREVKCPKCEGHFFLRRALAPHFDSSGFESYQFDCEFCEASLTGIIDPLEGALLVSAP